MIRRCWCLLLCALVVLTACGTPAASQAVQPTPARANPAEVPTATIAPKLTPTPKPPTATATAAATRPRPSPTATLAPTKPPSPTAVRLQGQLNVRESSGRCQMSLPAGFGPDGANADSWVSTDRLIFIRLESINWKSPAPLAEVAGRGTAAVQQALGSYQETSRNATSHALRIGFAGTFGAGRAWGTLYLRQFGQDYCQITVVATEGTTVVIDPVLETLIGTLAAPNSTPTPANYLALGDSFATGTGASDPATKGYAGLFAASLRGNGPAITYTNQGAAGATSADFLGDWPTRGAEGTSPLANAVQALKAGGVSVVTLDIGGNDILRLLKPGQPCAGKLIESDACFVAMRAALREMTMPNLTRIVAALVEAAPAGAHVIVLTYPNPFSTGQATTAEERTDAAMTELNILIANAVRAHEAGAAGRDVRLSLVELAPLFEGKGAKLTHIADTAPDIHPNDAGHAAIAEAIAKAYGKP